MFTRNRILLFLFTAGCGFLLACQKPVTDRFIIGSSLNLPTEPFNYATPPLPTFFADSFIARFDNTPINNPISNWGATLGRVLFYDKDLSLTQTLACASCHQQAFGFADTARLSIGHTGGKTTRHGMSLINARYYQNGRFFWDERVSSLEDQVLQPVQDSIEMGMTIERMIARLQAKPYYPILYRYAFGSETINADRTAKALAQFVRSIVSYRSKYDQAREQVNSRYIPFPSFTGEENFGKDIFMNNLTVNCGGCHNTDLFISDQPRNNGSQLTNVDPGIFIHTRNANDIGKFKAPSLKSILLRKFYMHDASLQGIDAVIEHYNIGILPNPNLDDHLINTNTKLPQIMNLSNPEINALKAFLATLTDHALVNDEAFSDPFKK
jgi:cytochrome c peroxidase